VNTAMSLRDLNIAHDFLISQLSEVSQVDF
jgi:hypothetical protein